MAFNVAEFRANLVGDGARPNLFSVSLVFPAIATAGGPVASQKITFLAKTAQLPGSTVGQVPLYYFGRELKFAGNRTFADWSLQVINDEDFSVRTALESWMNSINSHAGNVRNSSGVSPSSYSTDATVTQYNKAGQAIQTYKFVGMFPLDVAPIDLDWGTNDTIEEFNVTFAYQYWTNEASTDTNG
jgi:hypothetical protein